MVLDFEYQVVRVYEYANHNEKNLVAGCASIAPLHIHHRLFLAVGTSNSKTTGVVESRRSYKHDYLNLYGQCTDPLRAFFAEFIQH